MAALTVRCLTNLATPQENFGLRIANCEFDFEFSRRSATETKVVFEPTVEMFLEAMKGVKPLSSGLQDRRSCFQLSYIAKSFGGAKRSRTSTSCLQGRHHAVRS